MKENKAVKFFIKLVLCFIIATAVILIFYQKFTNHIAYLEKFDESALIKATEKYGEGCTVIGRRYDSSNKSCNVGIMNNDETLIIVYVVKHYSYDNGEESFFAKETIVTTDVKNMMR